MPKDIQPDIKNLKSMEEVWTVLMNEYGRSHELVTECINGLTDFRFSGKTEGEKFVELYRKWTEVIADLEEVGEVEALNHESIIESVVKKFPSPECKSRYVKFTIAPENREKSELQVLRDFMCDEWSLQRDLIRILKPEKSKDGVFFYIYC